MMYWIGVLLASIGATLILSALALVSALVNDANAVVAALQGAELEEPVASAVALLGPGRRAGRRAGRGVRRAGRAVADRP